MWHLRELTILSLVVSAGCTEADFTGCAAGAVLSEPHTNPILY